MEDELIGALDQKRIVSGMAHWLASKCEGTEEGPFPIAFMHVRFREGIGLHWEDGKTSISSDRVPGVNADLPAFDESIREDEAEAGEEMQGPWR
jgi:hypothetical protein